MIRSTAARRLCATALLVASIVAWAGSYEDFFRAVDVDNVDTVRALLQRGFDPNSVDETGQSALFVALRGGSDKVGAALIQHPGTRVDAANAHGETALMMAALRGRLDWMQQLVARGASVDKPGWTPLQYAASGPERQAVVLLLDRGARIDAPSPTGVTALMLAAQYGSEDSAILLLTRGADPRLRDKQGLNASDFARRGGREELARRLERHSR